MEVRTAAQYHEAQKSPVTTGDHRAKLNRARWWYAKVHQLIIGCHPLQAYVYYRSKHHLEHSDEAMILFVVSSFVVHLSAHWSMRSSWKMEGMYSDLSNRGHEIIKAQGKLIDDMLGDIHGKQDGIDGRPGPSGEVH